MAFSLRRGTSSGRQALPKKLHPPLMENLTLAFGMLLMLTVMFLVLLALRILSLPSGCEESRKVRAVAAAPVMKEEKVPEEDWKPWVEILSWQPRIFRYHGFLRKEECEYVIALGKPHMKASGIVGLSDDGDMANNIRTSTGMFLERGQDETIRAIEKRIADITFIPPEHGEALQVLHYGVGQKYEPHVDFFSNEQYTNNGGQRVATLLMYLSDVEEGGETVFPLVTANVSASKDQLSLCAKEGLAVRPKMGDAVLFWSVRANGTTDTLSLHGSCPVIKGDKWSCTKWMHEREFI